MWFLPTPNSDEGLLNVQFMPINISQEETMEKHSAITAAAKVR
jgi:hypothetical protein